VRPAYHTFPTVPEWKINLGLNSNYIYPLPPFVWRIPYYRVRYIPSTIISITTCPKYNETNFGILLPPLQGCSSCSVDGLEQYDMCGVPELLLRPLAYFEIRFFVILSFVTSLIYSNINSRSLDLLASFSQGHV